MRRGREGSAVAYSIVVTVLFIFRLSAIFSAPMGPILLPHKLIQRERDEMRKGGGSLHYSSDGAVDLESLGDLLGSNITNVIITQA
jgi:hypothetical protein